MESSTIPVKEKKVTRRDFLKLSVAALFAATGAGAYVESKRREEIFENTEVNIFFSSHSSAVEVPSALRSQLLESDIFAPEGVGWIPEIQDQWQRISDGKETVSVKPESDFFTGEMAAVAGTKTKVLLLDLPYEDERVWDITEVMSKKAQNFDETFEERIKKLDTLSREEATLNRSREDAFLKNLGNAILDNYDNRKNKQGPLKVTVVFGMNHTRLYHKLTKQIKGSKRSIPSMSYGIHEEVLRRYLFAQDFSELRYNSVKLPDKELLAKFVMEQIIADVCVDAISKPNMDGYERTKVLRDAANKFDHEEVKTIWEWQKSQRLSSPDLKSHEPVSGFRDHLLTLLENKGLEINKT